MLCLMVICLPRTPRIRFSETEDEAASSWESAVDMVDARIPARIRPASTAQTMPFWLSRLAMRTMMVSESEPARLSSAPALVMARPTMPMNTATNSETMTQEVATRRDSLSFFSSSMAMKRSRMCGMPK